MPSIPILSTECDISKPCNAVILILSYASGVTVASFPSPKFSVTMNGRELLLLLLLLIPYTHVFYRRFVILSDVPFFADLTFSLSVSMCLGLYIFLCMFQSCGEPTRIFPERRFPPKNAIGNLVASDGVVKHQTPVVLRHASSTLLNISNVGKMPKKFLYSFSRFDKTGSLKTNTKSQFAGARWEIDCVLKRHEKEDFVVAPVQKDCPQLRVPHELRVVHAVVEHDECIITGLSLFTPFTSLRCRWMTRSMASLSKSEYTNRSGMNSP